MASLNSLSRSNDAARDEYHTSKTCAISTIASGGEVLVSDSHLETNRSFRGHQLGIELKVDALLGPARNIMIS